jgi:DNA repair exonuclease SbcCD ATPase subunit
MGNLSEIKSHLSSRRDDLLRKQAENDLLTRQIEELEEQALEATKALTVGQEALQFIEDVANARRSSIKERIEQVITEALQVIYGPAYSAVLIYSVKNNRSHLDIELVKDTKAGKVQRRMNGFGGGVSDTISTPLRLSVLLGSGQTAKVCVLDECYKHLDPDRIPFAASFVRQIAEQLGVQIIMLSHHEAMKEQAEVVYTIRDENGRSVISQGT